jgi:fructose-1-phosphate kinase PfkB-like protein
MFLCVSLNPAIDKRLVLPSLLRGRVNRVRTLQSFPGGKSAHVAMVLHTLGARPCWIGSCGGESGRELLVGLSALGIQATACATNQPTRTNLEIVEDDGTVTEILEPGSVASPAEWEQFESTCRKLFGEGAENASVIFSGSLPANAAKPHFVKPNREEAAQLLGRPVRSLSDAVSAVHKLLSLGAQSAALSLGPEGLLFCAAVDAPVIYAPVIPLQPRSTVGCGDSALAGFVFGIASGNSPQDTLRLAAACGQANCLADAPGAARFENIREFQKQISVQTLASGS